jgi:nitrogen fixation/metabolism regulation signal transduction histidine kinase
MVSLKDILDLTWVNVIFLTIIGIVIGSLVINCIYLYKKSKDSDNKMSNRWNKILFWVNIVSGLLLAFFSVYFIWKIFANVVESRSIPDMFDSFSKWLKSQISKQNKKNASNTKTSLNINSENQNYTNPENRGDTFFNQMVKDNKLLTKTMRSPS